MEPLVLLVDNGSRRAEATLRLRELAAALSVKLERPVAPVSLQHADKIPADELGGEPANVFAEYVQTRLQAGCREFIILPLFFGESRALTSFIPQQMALLAQTYGAFGVRVADVISPLPAGESRLVDIVASHVEKAAEHLDRSMTHVVLTDHGSPTPVVTNVRKWVAQQLAERLGGGIHLTQAVMERREGPEYDFNGRLLADELDHIASSDDQARVVVAMMFLLPGKHAGDGGDIAEICSAATERNSGLRLQVSALIGDHPLLVDILADRFAAATRR